MNVEKLIELVKTKPILYDKEHIGYNNFDLKKKNWDEISKTLGLPAEKCKYKWKCLKFQYAREKEKQNVPSGSAKKREWKYFQSMKIIDNYLKPKRKHNKIIRFENKMKDEETLLSSPEPSINVTSLSKDPISPSLPTDFEERDIFYLDGSNKSNASALSSSTKVTDNINNAEQSLNNFYRDLIKEVKQHEEENEVDLYFRSIAKIVKSQNLSNLQFLQLQANLTVFLKDELENM